MSKRREEPAEITKVAPSWLTDAAATDDSLANLERHRVLPRIKITQGLTDDDLKTMVGGEGVACLPGPGTIICTRPDIDEDGIHKVRMVILFSFTEYCLWSDRRDNNSANILDRTFDPASEIAKRAADKDAREEEYEGGPKGKPFKRRYVEHLNYACMVYDDDHPCYGQELIMSFERGEYYQGVNFANAIMQRRIPGTSKIAPLWSQVWEMSVGAHKNRDGNRWWGFDFNSPADVEERFIRQEDAAPFKAAHEKLKADFANKLIGVDRDDLDEDAAVEDLADAEDM